MTSDPDDRPPLIPEDAVMPTDALPLGDIIDRRFKALLSLACEPKQLTDALKAATEWWKVKKASDTGEGWGANLKGGTMRDES